MSDAQGRSKLLAIYVILLFLFLGVAIFGFLYDRISELEFFSSQTWLSMKTPLIVVTIIAFLASLIIATSRSSKKQEKADEDFARAQGWVYTRSYKDPDGRTESLMASLDKVCPEKKFRLGNSVTVESGVLSIRLFDCWYNVRDWGPRDHRGFACLVESQRFESTGPQADISMRSGIDGALLPNQVDMGESEFSRGFIVTCKDPAWARHVVKESLQRLLLEHWREDSIYSEINVGPGGAVIITGPDPSVEEWLAMIELARRFESGLE